MAKSPYRPDLKGRSKQAFRKGNPEIYGRAARDIGAVEQIGLIERRAAAIKERARTHFQTYQETWVAREAIEIWRRRARLHLDHPAPSGTPGEYVAQSIMGQARRNVMARATRRLTAINTIKTRMENAVVRNRQQPSRKYAGGEEPELKARYAIKPTFTRSMRHD